MSFKSKLKEIVFPRHQFNKVLIGPYKGLWIYQGEQMFRRTVVYYKAWEKMVTKHLKSWCGVGDTVLVVGAHVGIHALHAAKLVGPGGKVIAFEPWPENFEMLKKNTAKNAFNHLTTEQIAISNQVGAIEMEMGRNDGNHHIAEGESSNDTITVNTTTIDSYCTEHQLQPKVILVDVEGFELSVLEGMVNTLQQYQPNLILEHHDDIKPGISIELKKWLDKQGYQYYDIERHLYASKSFED